MARTLRVLCALLLLTAPLGGAQLPDAFFGHFGGTRTRELGVRWSVGVGAMLLSQYGHSWDGPPNVWNGPQDFTNFDLLETTVGYNYGSGGVQLDWPAPHGWWVLEGSATLGVTSDIITKSLQDAVHEFGRLPHVYRERVDSGDKLYGVEVVAAYWRSWPSATRGPSLDVFPTLGLMWSSYHSEVSAGVGFGFGFSWFRLQGSATHGWLYRRSSVAPALVAARLEPGYTRFQGSLALDRFRVGSLAGIIPLPGLGLTWSSGIFPNERETLVSIFVDFPGLSGSDTFRIEHVNDVVKKTINGVKDQGPTGGLRITYVRR